MTRAEARMTYDRIITRVQHEQEAEHDALILILSDPALTTEARTAAIKGCIYRARLSFERGWSRLKDLEARLL